MMPERYFMIDEIIRKSLCGALLTREEITALFKTPLFSGESALIQSASRRKSSKACGGKAEVHAQVGVNAAPCPCHCAFCSFAAQHKLFPEYEEFPVEDIVARAVQFEKDGANAVYLMGTAQYPIKQLIETGLEVRRALNADTPLIANTGDFTMEQGKQLREAGFAGIYHAVRLGEGRDTAIPVERRLNTFRVARESGLLLGTCVEPVGNEHTIEELTEKTLITRQARPVYSGSARRIPIPGTVLADHGITSEARMAHILAVVRLALDDEVPGNCTHEPNSLGTTAGANLLWAESGSNPRDIERDTEGARGMTVQQCRQILKEGEWDILDGPSLFYSHRKIAKEQVR
jgi:biotin synthase